MPVNRLARDTLLIQALDMADMPELDQHDRPSATIDSAAFSINWLQRCLDEIHQEFPWAGTIASVSGQVSALQTSAFAPSDFILDVRDGLWITFSGSKRRLFRRNFSDIVPLQERTFQSDAYVRGVPTQYAFTGRNLHLNQTPETGGYTYQLWYYQMPAVMSASATPNFPSDHVLVDFVYLRAMEWGRKLPQGAAMKYLREVEIPALRTSGLGQEPESDLVPLDPLRFVRGQKRHSPYTPWGWMGRDEYGF
jgi:hypothetical protein